MKAVKFAAMIMLGLFLPVATAEAQPVLSSSPADIPATVATSINSDGATFRTKANLLVAMIQLNENEQRVWFGVDSDLNISEVFSNRRSRANSTSPWYWDRDVSSATILNDAQASVQATDVFYSDTPAFRDVRTGTWYKYVMYLVYQLPCTPAVAGHIQVAFSNDGTTWTDRAYATYANGPTPSVECTLTTDWGSSVVGVTGIKVEAMSAVRDPTSGRIHIVGVEGDTAFLANPSMMSQTQTYRGWAESSNPALIYRGNQISSAGLFNPRLPGTVGDQYETYHYFINLGMTYDASSGTLYLGRGYPYPFTRDQGSPVTPCEMQYASCKPSPETLPNRIQIYKMNIGSLASISVIDAGTWVLVGDFGHMSGYRNVFSSASCMNTPLQPNQTNNNKDYASVSFLRDRNGHAQLVGGQLQVLAGDSEELYKSQGNACFVTGSEGQNYLLISR